MKVESVGQDCFLLSGYLDLANLMAWRTEMEGQLSPEAEASIDLSAMEFDGSAILALLVYLARRSILAGGSVRFEQVSPRLRQMAEMAELSSLLLHEP